jgi:hypothetical protein
MMIQSLQVLEQATRPEQLVDQIEEATKQTATTPPRWFKINEDRRFLQVFED